MNIATNCGLQQQYPYNNLERALFILLTYTGDLLFAVAFGMIAANSEVFPEHFKNILRNRNKIKLILKNKPISSQVRGRVEGYFADLRSRTSLKQSNMQILATYVSRQIFEDLIFLRAKPFLLNFPIFKDAGSFLLLREVAFKLDYVVYMPGDYIIIRNDIGEEIFFIIEGQVKVLTAREDETLVTLKPGDYFGEIALFLNTPKRMCSVVAGTYCELYVLRKKFLVEILKSFPNVKEMFIKETERRIAEFQKKSQKTRPSFITKSPFFKMKERRNTKATLFHNTLRSNEDGMNTVESNLPSSRNLKLNLEKNNMNFNHMVGSYKMMNSFIGEDEKNNNSEISAGFNESNVISPQKSSRLRIENNTMQNSRILDLRNEETILSSSSLGKKMSFYEEKIKSSTNLNEEDNGFL